MDYKRIMFFIGLGVILLIPRAAVSQSRKEVPAKASEEKGTTVTKPDQDFQKAREKFLKKDLEAAAAAIRKGAAYLESMEGRAAENRAQGYLAFNEGLERLAHRVEKGTVKSVKELDREFASTYYGLAQYHYLKATESWAKQETSDAGQELKASSTYLDGVLNHMEGKVETNVRSVNNNARLLAERLIKGAGWVNAEVEKEIKELGKEIENLGGKVKPASK